MALMATSFMIVTNSLMHKLSQTYPATQIILMKGQFGLLSLIFFVKRFKKAFRETQYWHWHLIRGIVGVVGNLLWIQALSRLMIANASALSLTSAFWSMLGGWVILREYFSYHRLAAVCTGFLGCLMILKPGTAEFSVDSLYPIGSAICFAISDLILRFTGRRDDVTVSVLVLTSIMILYGGWNSYNCWITPSFTDSMWLIVIGLGYGWGQLCLAKSYALLEASFLAPFKFIRYPAMIGVGAIFFSERIDFYSFIGGSIILASLILAWCEKIKKPS